MSDFSLRHELCLILGVYKHQLELRDELNKMSNYELMEALELALKFLSKD